MRLQSGKVYKIISVENRLAVAVEHDDMQEGALIKLTANEHSPSVLWILRRVTTGWYQIENVHTGKVLDTVAAGVESGTWVHQWSSVDSQNQHWRIKILEGDRVMLIARKSGRCLDIAQMAAVDGAQLQIWDNVEGQNQQWILQPVPLSGDQPEKTKTAAKKTSDKSSAIKKTSSTSAAAKRSSGKTGKAKSAKGASETPEESPK